MPTGQENISLSKEEQLKSKLFNTAAKRLRFAHKFTGGETSLNLLSLVMPSEISGWSNPSAAEIAAAKLLTNSANLQIISSLGYEVVEGVHFIVSSNSGLVFINGHTATAGEIYIGRFTVVPQSVLVADAKNYCRVIAYAVGDQIINVGFTYKVNHNSTQQKGDITVIKSGVQTLLRNVGNASASPLADGNYEEYDPTGSGYSAAIKLNQPADSAGFFIFEGGLQMTQGDVKIFGALERLASIVTSLASDSSQFFYGDNDLTRYLTASSSEVDRKTFGDLLLSTNKSLSQLTADLTPVTSAETAVPAAATDLTWNHTLGVVPPRWAVYAICKTSELGYAVGDVIDLTNNIDGDGARAITTWVNSTAVGIRLNTSGTFYIATRAGAGNAMITAANWRIIFKAWKM